MPVAEASPYEWYGPGARMDMSDETMRSIGQAPREERGVCYSIGEEEGDS